METPLVGIVMGSSSDWETMTKAEEVLRELGVPVEVAVLSAHRMPEETFAWAKSAASRGLKVVIAGAGGAAHLAGVVSGLTPLPVLGVPIQSRALSGLDSLLSIVQMPGGIPTATFAIGPAGATNAGIFAAKVLALSDPALAERLAAHRETLREKARAGDDEVQRLRSRATA